MILYGVRWMSESGRLRRHAHRTEGSAALHALAVLSPACPVVEVVAGGENASGVRRLSLGDAGVVDDGWVVTVEGRVLPRRDGPFARQLCLAVTS